MATFDLAEEYKKNSELQEDDVRSLREWIAKQPHLPKVSGKLQVFIIIIK